MDIDDNLRRMIAYHDWWSATYHDDVERMTLYNRITLDNICRFLPEDMEGVILDAGGGTGLWAIQLAQMGYRVVLVDISDGMLATARVKITEAGVADRIEVRHGDIREMSEFADGQFSMVICEGDPVSYCGDHESAVRELSRVVCDGGVVIASVDNRAAAINWLRESSDAAAVERLINEGEVFFGPEREEYRHWMHAFTPEELCDLFESNGLSVERLIGKPVIANRLALRNSEDKSVQDWLIKLELEHCDDPAYLAWGGHLEIVGRKR